MTPTSSIFIIIGIVTFSYLRLKSSRESAAVSCIEEDIKKGSVSGKNREKLESYLSEEGQDVSYYFIKGYRLRTCEGDSAINEVADILRNSVRKNDTVIRYGGEEMVMFISGIRPDAALRTADEIQKKLSEKSIEHKYSDISDKLTVSMGIYNTEYAGQDIYSLIDKADIALYRAKEKGRNRYEVYTEEY